MSGLGDALFLGSFYFVQDVIRGDYSGAVRAFPFAMPGFAVVGMLIYGYIKHPVVYIKGTLGVAMLLLLIASMWYFVGTFTEINLLVRLAIAIPVFFWLLSLIGKLFFSEEEKGSPPTKSGQ